MRWHLNTKEIRDQQLGYLGDYSRLRDQQVPKSLRLECAWSV